MKKLIIIFLCLAMSFSFISCSKNIKKDNDTTTTKSSDKENSTLSESTTKKASIINSDDSEITTVKFNGKDIKKVYLDISGMKINIDVNSEAISDLNEFENNPEVENEKINNPIGTMNVVYIDDTEDIVGTIHLGENNSYYLEYKNKSNKTVMIKLNDDNL